MNTNLIENKDYELIIKRLGINGEGIAYYKKQTVFVDGALPGETVDVKIINIKENYAIGTINQIEVPSPDRVKPPCEYYDECGGCQLQHLSYKAQLREKRQILMNSIDRYVRGDNKFRVLPMIGADNPFEYRNKAQLPFGTLDGKVKPGLFKPNSNRLVFINKCLVHKKETNKVISQITNLANKYKFSSYNQSNDRGHLRHIVVRQNEQNKLMVVVVAAFASAKLDEFCKEIIAFDNVISVYKSVNKEKKTVEIIGTQINKIKGKDTIGETVGSVNYELYPKAFFQLNTKQTEKLYKHIQSLIDPKKDKKILDAYCGVGTIGQYVSKMADEVRGIDISKDSIRSAEQNAKANHVKNVTYYRHDVEKQLVKFIDERWIPDVIIFDPPRTGLSQRTKEMIIKSRIKKVIYVSCNTSTLAKDLNFLSKRYKISDIQPFDMFPQTSHIESVVVLTRR